jgi:hypothetical protein
MSNKKTNRKNKTNLTVTWPSADKYFTIVDLMGTNKDFIPITLRVRLKNAIDDGTVSEIGTIHGGKGRPKLAFAMNPVTEEVLATARQAEVVLHDKYNTIKVLDVNAETVQENSTSPVEDVKVMNTTVNA